MKKCLFLFILCGLFSGYSIAEIVAIDVDRVEIRKVNISTISVNQICAHSKALDLIARNSYMDCQEALLAQSDFINKQQNNEVQP